LEVARTADGYGGVLIQSCRINDQDVTVLYGHLDPASFTKQPGQPVSSGEKLAVLGDEKSAESGFTRKHLHLGIHKGKDIALLGYVQSQSQLEEYIDPLPLLVPSK
jgi:murein DD-endopeptidase MepM/ murein hydrolase activator NlpD